MGVVGSLVIGQARHLSSFCAKSRFNRGCSGQPEFRDQPVLEGSRGTFHPFFGLGWQGEYHLDTQFCHGPSELGGRSGRPGSGRVLEEVLPEGSRDSRRGAAWRSV